MMRRRAFFATVAATVGLAGCLGDESGTTLGEPEQERGSPSHATHGEELPDFEVPDPLNDEMVSRDDLADDGPFVLTFIYTSCTDRCGEIMRLLELIQSDAIDEGWDGDVSLAAMTFDPETDDADTLRSYGNGYGLDIDHERFRFLRPESGEEAIDLVDDHFSVPAEHGDHHDDHQHDEGAHVHYYMLFLVNGDGIVERSYPGPILFDRSPNDLIDDVRTVVT